MTWGLLFTGLCVWFSWSILCYLAGVWVARQRYAERQKASVLHAKPLKPPLHLVDPPPARCVDCGFPLPVRGHGQSFRWRDDVIGVVSAPLCEPCYYHRLGDTPKRVPFNYESE